MAKSIANATAIMAAGTLTSRVLGFVKAILLAYAIGQTASLTADAYNIGGMLPGAIFTILMGGMLNAVLVPQIVRAAKNPDGGIAYINKLLTLVIVLLAGLTALIMLVAPALVWIYATQFPPAQLALATTFAYWFLPQVFFYGVYTVMGEVLNARSVFGPYTWAPVLNNVVSIAGIIIFILLYGADPDGVRKVDALDPIAIAVLAGSATLGIVCQALILSVSWRRAGLRYRPDFQWRGVGLSTAAKLSGWSFGMLLITQIVSLIMSNVIASVSGDGPASAAQTNAWLIVMLPHSIFAVSLATAYFTRFSEAGAAGDMRAYVANFSDSLRQIAVAMVFCAALILAAAPQLSRILQVRAAPEHIESFVLVVQASVFALIPYSFLFVVQRAYYALSDTKSPFKFTVLQLLTFLPLSLSCVLVDVKYRTAAVVLAYAIALAVQVCCAVFVLRKRVGYLDGRQIVISLAKFFVAALPVLAIVSFITSATKKLDPVMQLHDAVFSLLIAALLSVFVYLGSLYLLRAKEVTALLTALKAKISR